ncbi:MAG TPA: rRNA maturation RNase YbeY [Bacteroidales bacterium]|nr:rRNA maturation RNase YbeY [Bacteroidales bacterium]HPO65052.1 rRNA maturation RNase YbeY [Bacteroidales bacterium]
MTVRFYNIHPSIRLHLQFSQVKNCIQQLAKLEGCNIGNISVIFCDNHYIYQLNSAYLKHFYPTDVITFDYTEGKRLSGDIFIGLDVVNSNAKRLGVTFRDELLRVVLHGVLHLCGYKDKTVRQKMLMRAKEDYYLKMCCENEG